MKRIALLAACGLTACQPAVLDPQGVVGSANKTILIDSLAIMLAIVIPTIVATLAFAWWFRASNTKARYLPNWAYSGQLELIVWAIPLLTIMLLGGVAWVGSHDLDPYKAIRRRRNRGCLDVQIVSLDWKWLFIYPDQNVASVNRAGDPGWCDPFTSSLTSASVMNAFFIPQLGSMIYTMNGMTTQLNLRADKAGTFPGLSSHYSGDGFSDMHFDVQAMPAEQFAAWVKTTQGKAMADVDSASMPSLPSRASTWRPPPTATSTRSVHKIVTQALAAWARSGTGNRTAQSGHSAAGGAVACWASSPGEPFPRPADPDGGVRRRRR